MAKKKTYAVFGLGRYGKSVALELIKNEMEVLAVDINEENVADCITEMPICKCADVTELDVLKNLGIENVDIVIIAMASNLEASIMATTLCKELGVETVIVKCANEIHQKILSKVGADKVVFPENESGIRLAKNLITSNFIDMIELSDDVVITEIDLPKKWENETLMSLNIRKKYEINVIAINYGHYTSINIDPNDTLTYGMKLIILAHRNKLKKLTKDIW